MGQSSIPALSKELTVVREEQSLLDATLAAIARAKARAERAGETSDLRSVDALRALREEARTASEDDLPNLLHEMGVRQKLLERPPEALPDPSSPYLAHLRVREGKTVIDYLLGHVSLVDSAAGVRLVDFRRSPIAQVFYRCREGDEYEEELPGRTAEGVVLARRIVVIEGGRLERILGDGIALGHAADGGWVSLDRGGLALHAGGSGTATRPGALGVGVGAGERVQLRDVTALLDREQYDAICVPPEEPLVVLGSAGSGKTTVALHRLARLSAQDPERFSPARTRVVVPEEGIARLSRRLLEPLGVDGSSVQTLDEWAIALAGRVFGTPLPRFAEETPALVSTLKRHPALYTALRGHFASLPEKKTTLKGLRKRLAEVLTDRPFLASVVASAGGTLSGAAVDATVRHTMLQLATPVSAELRSITVKERKRAVDDRPIDEGTPEQLAGTVDLEDLPLLLFLKAFRSRLDGEPIAHLVLDETEDFARFELFCLGELLDPGRSVTLAGDAAQATTACFLGFEDALATLAVANASTVRLSVSYRCPAPVVELAESILGELSGGGGTRAARAGVPVGRFRFASDAQAALFVAGAVADLADREPMASIAVVASDAAAAREFFAPLHERPDARLVTDGRFSFEPGIDVTDVDAVKGLEFDYVVVPDATAAAYPRTDEARRRLHVAVTRTAHQLWLVSGGEPTPLVAF